VWQEYVSPASVEETVQTLAAHGGEARVIAGGTDLVIQLGKKERAARYLVDITCIDELRHIGLDGDMIVVGAAVTHHQVAYSELLRMHGSALAEAARAVGSPQIRRMGTVVGNVVNAQPAADGSIALMALGAEAKVVSQAGHCWTPLNELFIGPGLSSVDSTAELVTAVRFPALGPNQGSAFERIAKRRALALPMLNVAVALTLDNEDLVCTHSRISLGPVAPVPFRAIRAEQELHGSVVGEESIERVLDAAVEEAQPRSSTLRASREYRQDLVRVLLRRAINRAVTIARWGESR
jgi:carbon-monoxide dehydrogenase medium subunit